MVSCITESMMRMLKYHSFDNAGVKKTTHCFAPWRSRNASIIRIPVILHAPCMQNGSFLMIDARQGLPNAQQQTAMQFVHGVLSAFARCFFTLQ
jgi:hypothetical protein